MLFAPLFLLAGVAHALPWDGVKPTKQVAQPLQYYAPPEPTEVVDLRKRQAPGDITCAWENGEGTSSYELYCASQKVCATNSLSVMGCCELSTLDNCPLLTTCIDNTAIAGYSASYGIDPNALSCTNTQNPICVTQFIQLDNVVTGWACGAESNAKTETYYSSYWNASAASTSSHVSYYNAVYFSYTLPSLISASQSSTTTSITSSTSAASTTTSSPTGSSTPTTTPAPSSSTPIGAIVGGTIGGVAVIGGLLLLAFFLFRRSKAEKSSQPPYTGEATVVQQPQGPAPPAQFAQYPAQPGYAYGGQPPAQSGYPMDPASYSEKLSAQGSPQMSSTSPISQDMRMSVPPYTPAAIELASNTGDISAATGRPVHEMGE